MQYFEKKYKVRKATDKYGYETTLNPLWVTNHKLNGRTLRHVFNVLYVIVPPGVEVDAKKLGESIKVKT